MMARFLRLRLRWRIALALPAALLAVFLALLLFLWVDYGRTGGRTLDRWTPASATAVLRVRDLRELAAAWEASSARGALARHRDRIDTILADAELILPAVLDDEYRVDLDALAPENAPAFLTSERILGAIDRDLLVVFDARNGMRSAAVATRLPFTTFAALRVACALGIAGISSVQDTAGVLQMETGAGTRYLALDGDVLLLGTDATDVAAMRTTGAGGASSGVLANGVADAPPGDVVFAVDFDGLQARDLGAYAAVQTLLHGMPVQEAVWSFDLAGCRQVSGRLLLGEDGVRLSGTGTADAARAPARVRPAFAGGPAPWAVSAALPDSTVFVSLARNQGPAAWECLEALVREPRRGGLHPALTQILSAVYEQAGKLLTIAAERGLRDELTRNLGGEVAWVVFAEESSQPGERVPGLALVAQVADGDAVMAALDRCMDQLGEASEDAILVARTEIAGVDVRALSSRLNRWSELISPAYAVCDGRLVISSTLSYLRRLLPTPGRAPAPARWRRSAAEVITLDACGAVVLDFAGVADLLEGTASGIATLLSDRVDRRALRDRLRPEVAAATGSKGEALELALDGAVARAVDEEQGRLAAEIRQLGGVARQGAALAAEWAVVGETFTWCIVLSIP